MSVVYFVLRSFFFHEGAWDGYQWLQAKYLAVSPYSIPYCFQDPLSFLSKVLREDKG